MLNDKTHSVLIYHFTDPMMGLTYESEPFFRQLETHFGERVRLQFMMGGLVRDVADFMIADDFKDGKEHAFIRYNARLAKIYKSEQSISGMLIKMDRLNLFAENRRSSIPLNLAFKAVERIYPDKAEHFLYRLRYATIVEQRTTTDESELAQITLKALQNFIQKRPLVALTEIRHAFCLADNQAVTNWLDKIPNAWQWVGQGFIKSVV